jgi:hypothetical protein
VVTKVKVSAVVDKQLPGHFIESETELIALLKQYYLWMESPNGVMDSIQNTYENFYIDTADSGFLKFFTKRVIPNIPQDALVDKKLIAKYARQFYQSKGSEDSFKFLFRAVYGKSLEIAYPKLDLFRTSSASWLGQHALKIYTPDPAITGIKGRKLIGQDSGATCVVQSIVQYQDHYVLTVDSPFGVFVVDEVVFTEPVDGNNVVYARTVGQINTSQIIAGGSGYAVGEQLLCIGGDGQDLIATISEVSSTGAITKVSITDGGFGYVSTPPTFIGIAGASSGLGANVKLFIGAMVSLFNFYDDSDFLSSSKKLQDGYYYQDYSYVLKSAMSSSVYKLLVDSLLHPSGTQQFNEYIADAAETITAWYAGIKNVSTIVDKSLTLGDTNVIPFIVSFGMGVELVLISRPTATGGSGDIILPYASFPISQYASIRIMDITSTQTMGVKHSASFVSIS